jgi:hypothetical protein
MSNRRKEFPMNNPLSPLARHLLPDHLLDCRPDPNSPHRRRFTHGYRRKMGLVKNLWIGAGLLVLFHPSPVVLLTAGLSMTFVAFTLLDETR